MSNLMYLQTYQQEWGIKFTQEEKDIRKILGDAVKDVQHIGSTSIPGMIAKPIIDIGVLVESIEDISYFTKKLETLGYSYKPEMSSVERVFLRKGDSFTHHLSITCSRHTFWTRNILFRDYLRNHSEFVEEYNKLKKENILITPEGDFNDLSRSKVYNKGKGWFVQKVLDLAK